jgi:hypothetical protein
VSFVKKVKRLDEEKKPEISEDLRDLISSTIESIREGMKGKDCGVVGTIKFELAVVKTKGTSGGFKFLIAEVGGNYSKESISKIAFEIGGTRVRGHGFPFQWLIENK